jgi:tRNA threonylcarbamoyladenosine modification (KEOPS) complex  Pcc1 subunit
MAKANAALRIVFRSERQMRAIADGLRPEALHPAGSKASVKIIAQRSQLVLRFEGKDSTTLRAIVSSYLRMLTASLNTCNAILQLERASPVQEKTRTKPRM